MTDPTADDLRARWGAAIRKKRTVAEMSQVELAQRCGLDQKTISRLERGKGPLDTFLAVARQLGVDLLPTEACAS